MEAKASVSRFELISSCLQLLCCAIISLVLPLSHLIGHRLDEKEVKLKKLYNFMIDVREGTFLIGGGGGGVGRGILKIFGQKRRGPPTSQIGFMHDPS